MMLTDQEKCISCNLSPGQTMVYQTPKTTTCSLSSTSTGQSDSVCIQKMYALQMPRSSFIAVQELAELAFS
eukprot:m.295554 g.295554  ORF g.295554 m.295554 type:complete len:71 (-) comp249987_c0_seq1:131-343(-)